MARKIAAPQCPVKARYSTAGISTRAAPVGRKAAIVASTPNTTGEGSFTIAKPMPTITPCSSAVAAEPNTTARVTSPRYFSSCARRAALHRHEPHQLLEHRAPVAQQEEQHEDHEEETDQRAEHVERDAAAHGGGALEDRLQPVGEPALHLLGADCWCSPAPTRPRCRSADSWRAGGRVPDRTRRVCARRYSMTRATWPANTAPSTDSGTNTRNGVTPGDEAGGPGLAALEAARQALVQRVEDEGEHDGPADDAEERRDDAVERVAEDRRGDDEEAAAVEVRMHGLPRV